MADLTDTLLQQGFASAQATPDAVGSMEKGAQLATQVENIQQSRQKLEMAKQQLEMQKLDKISSLYEALSKIPEGGARKSFANDYIPQAINALGYGDKIHPVVQDMLKAEPEAVGLIKSRLNAGDISLPNIYEALKNPEKMTEFLNTTGLKQYGGEQALRDAMVNYPEGIQKADLEGTKLKAQRDNAIIRTDPQTDRITEQVHNNALQDLLKPTSIVQKKLGAYQSIDNALASFRAAPSTQEFEQLQTQLRLNQGATGGKTGVNERAAAHAHDLGITTAKYVQIATGNLQDVNLSSPGLVKAVEDVAAIELSQIKTQAMQSIDTARKGRQAFYKKHPDKSSDYEDTVQSIKDQFNSTQGPSEDQKAAFMKLSPEKQAFLRNKGLAPKGL